MDIKVVKTELEGVLMVTPEVFEDERGFFMESYHKKRLTDHGFDHTFVQDNHSRSTYGVLRGFHYQDMRAPQFRLVRCTVGEIWDVVVDLGMGSATFGRWAGFSLTAENRRQLLIPPEFAHGFVVLSERAEVQYKCTNHHSPAAERVLSWNDPDIGVSWPIKDPIVSDKDKSKGMSFKEYLMNPSFT